MTDRREVLPWKVVLSYAVGAFGQGLLPLIVGSWIMYFYSPPKKEGGVILVSAGAFATIRLLERVAGAFVEPLVGHLSDRTRSRFGRRRPWIAVGLPFLVISFSALFFPPSGLPVDSPRVMAHLGVALMVFYLSYTAVFAPYSALHPEITRSGAQRVRLSVWMSVFEVLSNVVGSLAASPLIAIGAITVAGIAFANGFEVLAVAAAVAAAVAMLPVILFSPERADTEPKRSFGFLEAAVASLSNRAFLCYGAMIYSLRVASFSAVIAIPYLATELMGVETSTAPLMLAVIIVVATCAFPLVQRLADRNGKATVARWGGLGFLVTLPLMGTIGLTPIPAVIHGVILFFMAGFSTATLFVLPRPILADVIDHDERRTGLRREAMYTGMSGVVEKLGEATAAGAVGYLFELAGNSADSPTGLRLVGFIGVGAILFGLTVFRRYPLE